VVWSHNNIATITGWPAGHESHFGCILEAVFTHRLIVSHDQAVQQRTRVPEKSHFEQLRKKTGPIFEDSIWIGSPDHADSRGELGSVVGGGITLHSVGAYRCSQQLDHSQV